MKVTVKDRYINILNHKTKRMNIDNMIGKIANSYPIDINSKNSRSVLLAGVSRSGTTWASNVINHKNTYREIFEPFHPKHVPLFRSYNDRTYIRPSDNGQLAVSDIGLVVSGQLRSRWSDQYNKRLLSTKRLVKTTRLIYSLLG